MSVNCKDEISILLELLSISCPFSHPTAAAQQQGDQTWLFPAKVATFDPSLAGKISRGGYPPIWRVKIWAPKPLKMGKFSRNYTNFQKFLKILSRKSNFFSVGKFTILHCMERFGHFLAKAYFKTYFVQIVLKNGLS